MPQSGWFVSSADSLAHLLPVEQGDVDRANRKIRKRMAQLL